MPNHSPICVVIALLTSLGVAVGSEVSHFTETVKEVRVLQANTKHTIDARAGEPVKGLDTIQTGTTSRAEVSTAKDLVTRIGADSVVHIDSTTRSIDLEKGSVLLSGTRESKVRTTSASASLVGGTLIVSTTPDGGSKVLVLAGRSRVKMHSGKSVTLKAGEMIFAAPQKKGSSETVTFSLNDQVAGSLLVNGFKQALPGSDLIVNEIARQNHLLAEAQTDDSDPSLNRLGSAQSLETIDSVLLQQNFIAQESNLRTIPTRTLRVPVPGVVVGVNFPTAPSVPPREIHPVPAVPLIPVSNPAPPPYHGGSTMVTIRDLTLIGPVPIPFPPGGYEIIKGNNSAVQRTR